MREDRLFIKIERDKQTIEVGGSIPVIELWETVPRRGRGEIPRGPGCYALFRNGRIVYIGEASNLNSRLGNHQVKYDRIAWLRVDGAQRLLVEKLLIWVYMPEENGELQRHDRRMHIKEVLTQKEGETDAQV